MNIHKRTLLVASCCVIMLSTQLTAGENDRVANFSSGKPGTNNFEKLSFWVHDNENIEIIYYYGKDMRELQLQYIDNKVNGKESYFRARFPNGYIIKIVPNVPNLLVVNEQVKYSKIFRWQYEGPVNGIGTYCSECVEEDREAIKFVKRHFIK